MSVWHIFLSLAAAETIFGFFLNKKKVKKKSFHQIFVFCSMKVKWYHFVLLVTLANANPIGNPAEEQFLKKYFNSGFEFKSDEEKSFRTVSNYAKVRVKIVLNI